VDRIMDSMRVVTNLLGNCVAVFAVSRWEGALDIDRAKKVLAGEGVPTVVEALVPAQQAKEPAKEPSKEPATESAKEPASEVS
jgi:aerobic C4-dicarboxylate transport protein